MPEENKLTRAEVYALIDAERTYQEKVWPSGTSEKKVPTEFAVYMQTYLQTYLLEAMAHVSKNPGYDGLLSGIRKVTALGVACMEKFGAPEPSGAEIKLASSRRPVDPGAFDALRKTGDEVRNADKPYMPPAVVSLGQLVPRRGMSGE